MAEEKERIQFFTHFTRTVFLHLEDALDLGKVRFFAGKYKRGSGMDKGVYHFVDVDDLRPVLMDLSWGKAVEFVDYKGGSNGNREIISRVLSIKTQDDTTWIEIKNGPGTKTDTGAVMPAGKNADSVSLPLKVAEVRRLALAVLAYISAFETARAVVDLMGKPSVAYSEKKQPEIKVLVPDIEDAVDVVPVETPQTGEPGISPAFLVREGIVKHVNDGRAMMELLGMLDGEPAEKGMKVIRLFLKWRQEPGFSSKRDKQEAVDAASKAILGEVPPANQ